MTEEVNTDECGLTPLYVAAIAPKGINRLCNEAHHNAVAHGFWEKKLSPLEKVALIGLMHSELSEAVEALRDPGIVDKHLPHLHPVGVELADCVIRIFDFCAGHNIDLEKCVLEKMEYNKSRPYKHGKKC